MLSCMFKTSIIHSYKIFQLLQIVIYLENYEFIFPRIIQLLTKIYNDLNKNGYITWQMR